MRPNVISRRVASSFHVREDTDTRLVLQANWMDSCGCAMVFIAFGALWLFMVWGEDLGSRLFGGLVGGGFCLAGLAAIVIGLMGSNRRIVFDHGAREVRLIGMADGPSKVSYRALSRLEQRDIDISDSDGTLTYYNLYLITIAGEEIPLCQSRDRRVIRDLERRLEPVLRKGDADSDASSRPETQS